MHAKRHETSPLLAASGVHLKTAQSHMRHSGINLTMTAYGHTLTGQEAAAVEALPDLSLPSRQQQMATGTDDRQVNAVDDYTMELPPKWTPQLTPTAYSECDELASGVNQSSLHSERNENRKNFTAEKLGTKRNKLSLHDTNKNGEGGIRTRGALKEHTGFRNRLDQPLRHLSKSRLTLHPTDQYCKKISIAPW